MISEIRLRNFKCFVNESLTLRPLTVLCGLNGVGKSTIIQSLLLLRQTRQQRLETTALALNGDLVSIGTARDALYDGATEDIIGIGITADDVRYDPLFRYSSAESNILEVIDPAVWSDSSLFSDQFQYLAAERSSPRVSFDVSEFQVRLHRFLGVHGEYAPHFLAVYGRLPIQNPAIAHPASASPGISDQVEAWLGEVSPGTRLEITPLPTIDAVNLQYQFIGSDQLPNTYRTTNVGFGLTYTLPVVTALVASEPFSLVIIENPEAHLHPRGQLKMGELASRAAEGGAQVIIETHSDHVLNGIRLAVHGGAVTPETVQLHYFRRTPNESRSSHTSPKIDRDGRIDQWPEGFFDEFSRSLEALMEPHQK